MKLLIKESQRKQILDKYLNDIIKSPEYSFIDEIEVVQGTTIKGSWRKEYSVPYYEYVIHFKDKIDLSREELNLASDLMEKISTTHGIMFPVENGSPTAYYSIDTR